MQCMARPLQLLPHCVICFQPTANKSIIMAETDCYVAPPALASATNTTHSNIFYNASNHTRLHGARTSTELAQETKAWWPSTSTSARLWLWSETRSQRERKSHCTESCLCKEPQNPCFTVVYEMAYDNNNLTVHLEFSQDTSGGGHASQI